MCVCVCVCVYVCMCVCVCVCVCVSTVVRHEILRGEFHCEKHVCVVRQIVGPETRS